MDSRVKGTKNVPHCGSGVLTEPPYLEKAPHGSYHTGLLKVGVGIDFANKGFGYTFSRGIGRLCVLVCKDFVNKGFRYFDLPILIAVPTGRADRLKERRLWVQL